MIRPTRPKLFLSFPFRVLPLKLLRVWSLLSSGHMIVTYKGDDLLTLEGRPPILQVIMHLLIAIDIYSVFYTE